MVEKISVYQGYANNPHYNLAVEKYLLDTVAPNECILYLWQNQNTVVIGRNQNAWLECRTTLLEEEGGHLARRLSGGGAVFHDLGNLNFTFLISKENYDVDRQLSVIQAACALAGIRAEKSGRNDLLAEGSKFSGNAFYQVGQNAYHHGTLLIDVDMDKLSRYLSPSKAKLEAKGVSSVRSRVINLKELSPGLTCEKMRELMIKGFEEVYGLTAENITIPREAMAGIEETARHNGSWDFLYGTPLPFTFSCERKFDWGIFQLQLQAKNGIIQAVKVYSDAMDWTLPAKVEQALTGCRFSLSDMQAALKDFPDLCALLEEQAL